MIQLQKVSKIYEMGNDKVYALDHASMEIQRGEFVSIVGPSGSGKSTLMNIIGCLDVADEGNYILDGISVEHYSERELAKIRNRKIGFIFQNFNLLPRLTAEENVELPLIYRNVQAARRRELSVASLKKVGLENRMEHKPSEMSGGQQQRVAIARALAAAPPMILADEPTGNLDSASSKEIMQILRGLHEEGRTVILITHDNKIAESAKRVIRIMDGKVVSDTAVKKKKEKKGKGEVE